ncbi:MAG: leucine-rich repeat domain-containing protein [Cytophagales bacterium]|nr:leucine-rich repeat domain-containing protein [Cytophagales bacterium]
MNCRYIGTPLSLICLIVYVSSFAQKADEIAKSEVIKILQNYENALNALGDTAMSNEERKPTLKKFRKDFEAKDIFVFNDLPEDTTVGKDSTSIGDKLPGFSQARRDSAEEYLTIYQYFKDLPVLYPNGFKIMLDRKKVRIGPIKKNKKRNTYMIVANVIKRIEITDVILDTGRHTFSRASDTLVPPYLPAKGKAQTWQVGGSGISSRLVEDTMRIDTSATDTLAKEKRSDMLTSTIYDTIAFDSVRYDTVTNRKSYHLTFFIKLDIKEQIPQNFKVYAISKTGDEPRLKPLPEIVSWWVSMDDPWKKVFSEKLTFPEFPGVKELNHVYSLRELTCSGEDITTLEPIRNLKQLRILKCSGTSVSSLEPVAELENLVWLKINKNKLTSLELIKNLVNLQKLECSGQDISSLAPLKNLVNLIELDCSDNELEDIEPLRYLDSLERVDFSLNTDISNIEPVRKLTKLVELRFGKIDIKSLEPVKNLTNLIELDCFNTEISSLEPLKGLRKLALLNCSYTKITTLDPISKHRYIAWLYISGNTIDDIGFLKNFTFLKELDISKTSVSSLDAIQKLEFIEMLKCFYTKISKEEVQRFKKKHPRCAITYY